MGKIGRGGSSASPRGAGRRGGSNFSGGRQKNYVSDYMPRDSAPYGRSNNVPFLSYGGSGNGRDNGHHTCFKCESSWYQAK